MASLGDGVALALFCVLGAFISVVTGRLRAAGSEQTRRAEEALRQVEAKFRSYIERSPLAIFVADREGRIVDASGTPSERLLAIGAPRRASAWETTSIPDIAVHALAIARRIVP